MSFNVTLDANGGSCTTSTLKCTPNGTYVGLDSVSPTRTGYTFTGWYTASSGGTKKTASDTVTSNSAHTLYAQWTANTYTVSYALNGGTLDGSTAPASTTATYDTAITINNPTKSGCTFDGWNIAGMDSCTHTYGASTGTQTDLSNQTATSFKNLRATTGTVTFTAAWTHNHVWSYTAAGNKITSTCSADNCTVTANTATLELNTKSDVRYTGTTADKSDIFSTTDFSAFNTATGTTNLSASDVKIYAADSTGNKTGSDLTGTTLAVGNYIAELTCNGVTATKAFEVKKALPTIGTQPAAVTGLIYTGEAQTLINAASAVNGGTIKYSLSQDGTYSEALPTGTGAGTYTVYYKVFGDSNHEDTTPVAISVTIAKKDQTISAPTVSSKNEVGVGSVCLDSNAAGQGTTKYAVSETDLAPATGWQESTEFTNLKYNTTYYFFAKYEGNDNYNPVISTSVSEMLNDTTDPTGTVSVGTVTEFNPITYWLYYNQTQLVTVTASDSGAGIDSIKYLVANSGVAASIIASKADSEWTAYTDVGVRLDPTKKYVVYFKISDKADNVLYLCSNGVEVDVDTPVITGLQVGKTYTCDPSTRAFEVTDFDLDSVVAVRKISDTTTANITLTAGTASLLASGDTKTEFTLPAGTYTEITATDKCGNTTTIKNVTVQLGYNAPTPTDDNTNTTYSEGTSYDVKDNNNNIVYSYKYSDVPGQCELTFSGDDYEVFAGGSDTPLGTADESGNITVTIKTGTTYYIRKKATEGMEASDLVSISIPKLSAYTVALSASPSDAGTVAIGSGSAANVVSGQVYTGKTTEITATPKLGYAFVKWIDKKTGGSFSNDATVTVSSAQSLIAVFKADGSDIVEIPEVFLQTGTIHNYTGSEVVYWDTDANPLPEGCSFTEDSVLSATDVGTYSFTIKLDEGRKWSDGTTGTKTFKWNIYKQKYSDAYGPFTVPAGITYDPTEGTISGFTSGEYEIMKPDGTIETVTGDTYTVGDSTGKYYIRKKATDTTEASNWAAFQAGNETPALKQAVPGAISYDSVTINAKLSTVEGVTGEVIKYRKKGSDEWLTKEITPITATVSEELTDLDSDTEYEYCIETTDDFGKTVTSDTKTFKTAKDNRPTGNITCDIENGLGDGTTVSAVITIERGNTAIAAQSVSITDGKTEVVGPFKYLEDGVYNVVLRTADGNFTETKSITIADGSAEAVAFVITKGILSTKVEIKGEAPEAAVEGLPNLVTDTEQTDIENGAISVDITLGVAEKEESTLETEEKSDLQNLMDSTQEFANILDLSLTKTTSNLDASGQVTDMETEDIGRTNEEVLEIAVPFAKSLQRLLRYHNNIAQEFVKLSTRPAENYMDGTYYADDNYVYIYASGFSTYAFVTDVEASGLTINTPSTNTLTETGETLQLTAVVAPANTKDQTLTWTSSDPKVATVDENGKVTAVTNGKTTITASTVNGKTDSVEITVSIAAKSVKIDTPSKTTLTSKGDSVQLTATVGPNDTANKTLTWTSSDEKVITIDATGTATAVGEGTATVTVTTVNGKTDSVEITVKFEVKDGDGKKGGNSNGGKKHGSNDTNKDKHDSSANSPDDASAIENPEQADQAGTAEDQTNLTEDSSDSADQSTAIDQSDTGSDASATEDGAVLATNSASAFSFWWILIIIAAVAAIAVIIIVIVKNRKKKNEK